MFELLVLDGTGEITSRRWPPEAVASICEDARTSGDWWAGICRADDAARVLGFGEVALVAADPSRRAVAWVGESNHARRQPPEIAEALVAGSGRVWASNLRVVRPARPGWRALQRAHARGLLGKACRLPGALCRRLSGDEPAAVDRAVRTWLEGEEALAVQLIHSAVAARIATGASGYVVDEAFRARLFDADPTSFYDGHRSSRGNEHA